MYIDNIEEIAAALSNEDLTWDYGGLGEPAHEDMLKRGDYIFYNEMFYRVAKEF